LEIFYLGLKKKLMKNFWSITGCSAMLLIMTACGGPRRNPGRAYMPDMAYSRAYETYASTEKLKEKYPYITYNAKPVAGTMARGDMPAYELKNDSTGYAQSVNIKSPLDPAGVDMKEAERLYLVNCGICHGPKLDGNGPLWKDGNGPFPAKPANLATDTKYTAMTEGTMFHSVTYGKNTMGSYASQLSTKQRWQVIAYIKMKQAGGASKDTAGAKAPVMAAAKDTATKKTK
jgi:mono/diheme cytochrome c family protein